MQTSCTRQAEAESARLGKGRVEDMKPVGGRHFSLQIPNIFSHKCVLGNSEQLRYLVLNTRLHPCGGRKMFTHDFGALCLRSFWALYTLQKCVFGKSEPTLVFGSQCPKWAVMRALGCGVKN